MGHGKKIKDGNKNRSKTSRNSGEQDKDGYKRGTIAFKDIMATYELKKK